jgi:hypothetical protein
MPATSVKKLVGDPNGDILNTVLNGEDGPYQRKAEKGSCQAEEFMFLTAMMKKVMVSICTPLRERLRHE